MNECVPVADSDVQSASSAYAAYAATGGQTSTNYQNFYTAAHDNARVSLNTVANDLSQITGTYAAAVTDSVSLATDIINIQSPALPTPAVCLLTLHSPFLHAPAL